MTLTTNKLSLAGFAKPTLGAMPSVNLSALVGELGEEKKEGEAETTAGGKKLKPGERLNLDTKTMNCRRRSGARKFYDLTKSKCAIAQIVSLPDVEESVHCVMGGEYDGFDIVIAIQALAAAPVEHLRIATLGFNRYNINQLCAMLDAGLILKVDLVCSEYFASADPADFNGSRDELVNRGQRLIAVRNHAKILLFAIGSARYVVESSANLRSCNNLEQFVITQSVALYDFHAAWIERVFLHGDT